MDYAWAASYNMVLHKTLATMKTNASYVKNPEEQVSASLAPIAVCFRVKSANAARYTCVSAWVSAGLVRKRHFVCPATLEKNHLEWNKLDGCQSLLNVIKQQYQLVKGGSSVQIMRLFLASIGSLDGCVSCAKVKAFLKKLNQQLDADSDKDSADQGQDKLQEMGLNMLAEDAEASGNANNNADYTTNEDSGEDSGGEQEDEDKEFQKHMYAGIEQAFSTATDVYDDEKLEEQFEKHQSTGMGSAASSFEKDIVHAAINQGACNIDSAEHQKTISMLQSISGLDAIDAAFETAFASTMGADAVPDGDAGLCMG